MLQSKFFVNSPLVYGTIQSVMELTHASAVELRLRQFCVVSWGINPGMTNLYPHKLATTSATAI